MNKEKNVINKAVVLLIAVFMVTTMIPAALANTDVVQETSTDDVKAPPVNNRYIKCDVPLADNGPNRLTAAPVNGYSSSTLGPGPVFDFFFEQTIASSWTAYSISVGYPGIDNFFGLSADSDIDTLTFSGLAAYHDGTAWQQCAPGSLTFEVSFYSQDSSVHTMPPAGLVDTFTFGPGDYTIDGIGTFSGFDGYKWIFDMPTDVVVSNGGWVSIENIGATSSQGCLWLDSTDGDGFADAGGSTGADFAYTLTGAANFVCQPGACDFTVIGVEGIEDGGTINSMPRDINITVGNYGDIPLNDVKLLVDIYELGDPEKIVLFEDDFESYCVGRDDDNANWTTYDNGDGDTWTLVDTESHSGSQSYRCTAGNQRDPCDDCPDTYLGQAADSTPDSLISNNVDLTDALYIDVSFWHKTTGEYRTDAWGDIIPIDYGRLVQEIGGTISPFNRFTAYDNGWEKVTYRMLDNDVYVLGEPYPCDDNYDYIDGLVMNHRDFGFSWFADPSHQYEGMYIDDFKVELVKAPEASTPIWQGHEIVEIDGCVTEQNVVFPITFEGEIGKCYQMEIIAQVFDCDDSNLLNNALSIDFCIDDVHDMAAISIDGPAILDVDDDGVYEVVVENVGAFPENNVPVNLEISKSELFGSSSIIEDFESSPSAWMTGYFSGVRPVNLWSWSGDEAFSGTHSMVCANGAGMLEPDIGCLLLPDMVIDLRGDDILASELSYNIKWSIPDDGAWEDYFAIALAHPDSPWIIQTTFPAFMGSYQNEWCGPNNPGPWPVEMFSWDMKALLDDFMSSYPTIFTDERCELYFVVAANDNTNILNADNPEFWSGVMLDDISLRTTRTSSANSIVVDTQTTGLLNPGETETLEMNWEDATSGNWLVSGVTHLTNDVDNSNNAVYTQTDIKIVDTDISFESDDLTNTQEQTFWQIVEKEGFGSEPASDSYWWCGKEYATWAGYTNNMDDVLITEKIDLSQSAYGAGVRFSIDTWHEFVDAGDYGEIYYSTDNGTSWQYVAEITGTSDWYTVSYGIPAQDCTDEVRIKFRMLSDIEDVGNGWYIDDLTIDLLPELQRNVLCEGFNTEEPTWKTYNGEDDVVAVYDTQFAKYDSPYPALDIRVAPVHELTWRIHNTDDDKIIEVGPYDTHSIPDLDISFYYYMKTLPSTTEEYFDIVVYTDDGSDSWNIVHTETVHIPGATTNGQVNFNTDQYVGSSNFKVRIVIEQEYAESLYSFNIDDIELFDFTTIELEDFSPEDGLTTRGWTYDMIYNYDFSQVYSSRYVPTTWAPASTYVDPVEGNNLYGVGNDIKRTGYQYRQRELISTPELVYTLGPDEFLAVTFNTQVDEWNTGDPHENDFVRFYASSGVTFLNLKDSGPHSLDDVLYLPMPSDTEYVKFYRYTSMGGNGPWYIDDLCVSVYLPSETIIFTFEEGEGYYRDNDWKTESEHAGDYWQEDIVCSFGDYDGDGLAHGCIDYPATGKGLNDVLYTTIDLTSEEIIYAQYQFAISYLIDADNDCAAYVEISGNYDPSEDMATSSAIWVQVVSNGVESDSFGWLDYDLNLNNYLGRLVTVRFRLVTPGEDSFTPDTSSRAGYWVDGFTLITAENPPPTDVLAPITTIVFDDSGIVATATLLASDQAGPVVSGVASTFYILNGGAQQTYSAQIMLSEGSNTVEYWSVDNAGNIESHKSGTFMVDKSPPELTINSPVNGFYLFGTRLFAMNQIFCIGKITVDVSASDSSGINMVTFDTGSCNNFDADGSDGYTCVIKGRGAIEVVITAIDNNGLTTEETLNLKVFSLGS